MGTLTVGRSAEVVGAVEDPEVVRSDAELSKRTFTLIELLVMIAILD